jgi:signal recognition particle receptor subunit beta
MESLNGLGNGGAHLNTRLPRILAELQGLQVSLVAGASTGAAMVDAKGPLFGVDTVLAAWKQQPDGFGAFSDETATHLIIDTFPSGTMAVGASIADANSCVINGKTYTAKTVTPTQTDRGLVALQFYTGLQTGEAANGAVLTKAQLLAASMSNADADTVLTLANKEEYIAAWSLANAINAADSNVTASATLTSGTVTIRGKVEEATLVAGGGGMTSGTNLTRGAATITGGAVGVPKGTITAAVSVAGNTIVVGGTTYTAVAPTTVSPGLGKYAALAAADITVGSPCNARARLMETGLLMGAADAIISVADAAHANNATAYLIAYAINADESAAVTASAAAAVVTLVQKDTGAAAAVLTSSDGATLAVSGGGTLTAAARGWKNSASEASHFMTVFWFRKSRALGQW